MEIDRLRPKYRCFEASFLDFSICYRGPTPGLKWYEARGEKCKAADYYRKAADFAESNPGFDKQMVNWFLSEARRMKKVT